MGVLNFGRRFGFRSMFLVLALISLFTFLSVSAEVAVAVGTMIADNEEARTNHGLGQTLYAAGRFWVFYYNRTSGYLQYKTSTDGTTWIRPAVPDIRLGGQWDVHFDGTYLHFAHSRGLDDIGLYYRRGTPNSDGSITWSSASWYKAYDPGTDKTVKPAIGVTGSGKPVIALEETISSTNRDPFVTMSNTNDGTWVTRGGFPFKLKDEDEANEVDVVGLTGDKFYVVYAWKTAVEGYPYDVAGRLYDGSSMGAQEDLRYVHYNNPHEWDVVAIGDVVHYVSNDEASDYIKYRKRSAGGSWSAWTDLIYTPPYAYPDEFDEKSMPQIARADSQLLVFWGMTPSKKKLYYKLYDGSSWGPDIDFDSDGDFTNGKMAAGYEVLGNFIAVVYETDIDGDNLGDELMHTFLSLNPVVTSVTESMDPVMYLTEQTLTPSGMDDLNKNDMRIVCCQSVGSCTPTTSNNECTNVQWWPYGSDLDPYAGMDCKLTAPNVAVETTYNAYCRLYDGSGYSDPVSTSYVVIPPDTVPPQWRNQGQNVTMKSRWEAIELYAEGYDNFELDFAWLATDESGSWVEYKTTGSCMLCPVGHVDNGDGTCTVSIDDGDFDIIEDGFIMYDPSDGSYSRDTIGLSLRLSWNQALEPAGQENRERGYVEWDVSSIPNNAIVNDVDLIYHGRSFYAEPREFSVYSIESRPSLGLDADVFNDAGNGNLYKGSEYFQESPQQEVQLAASAASDLDAALDTRDWFAVGLKVAFEGGAGRYMSFHSEDSGDGDPKPTLRVTYTPRDPHACIQDMDDVQKTWEQAKFIWKNPSLDARTVSWRIYFNDTKNNIGMTDIMQFEHGDAQPPQWRNKGQTKDVFDPDETVELYAEGMDNLALSWAWLSTDESGQWMNISSRCPTGHVDNHDGTCTVDLDDPYQDVVIKYYSDTSSYSFDPSGSTIGGAFYEGGEIHRGYVEWDVSSIADGAEILDVDFVYHGAERLGDPPDCSVNSMENRPSKTTIEAVYQDCGDGTTYANPVGFPVVLENSVLDLGAGAVSDLQNAISSGVDWFAIGIQNNQEVWGATHYGRIYSEDYSSPNPRPTLRVTYTPTEDLYPTERSDQYQYMGDVQNTWVESRFVWKNTSLPKGTIVKWKIYYNDTEGNEAVTDEDNFQITPPPSPTINSLQFSTTLDQMDVSWVTEFEYEDLVDVVCILNGDDSRKCEYTGPPGSGSCSIMKGALPLYQMSRDVSGEPRTVQNDIQCTAYNHYDHLGQSSVSDSFYPLEFEVSAPSKLSCVVGEETLIGVTVRNRGTLSDAYTIAAISSNSQILGVEKPEYSTKTIGEGEYERVYVAVTPKSSEETAYVDLIVTSNTSRDYSEIKYYHTTVVEISDKSLPDFGWLGLLQIFLAAAILVNFLF